MTYHREQEFMAMGGTSARKDEESFSLDRKVPPTTTLAIEAFGKIWADNIYHVDFDHNDWTKRIASWGFHHGVDYERGSYGINNPASLSLNQVGDNTAERPTDEAQIAPRNDVVTPEDAQERGDYTREELAEIVAKSIAGKRWDLIEQPSGNTQSRSEYQHYMWTRWSAEASEALDALIACGALKVRGEK